MCRLIPIFDNGELTEFTQLISKLFIDLDGEPISCNNATNIKELEYDNAEQYWIIKVSERAMGIERLRSGQD
jgi:hypothetical protein